MERQGGRQAAIQAKAVAAAKLVLQDLDPAAKRRRQLFSSGPPQGILALHVKTLRNFSKTFFFTSTFAACTEIRLFLKIGVQKAVKCSKIVHVRKDAGAAKTKLVMGKQNKLFSKSRKSLRPDDTRGGRGSSFQRGSSAGHRDSLAGGNAEITIDELKIFSLELCNNRDNTENQITIELVEVEGSRGRPSINVGHASLHLFDLIKEMYATKSIPLMIKDKRIADLEYEYVFRYGTFGYGYSHEFQQNETPINQIMNESLFFKLDPPADRVDDDGMLAPTQVSAPNCISDGKGDEESTIMRNKAVTSSVDMFSKVDTSNLDELIDNRHRLSRLKKEYSALKTRHDRNKYLENLLAKTGVSANEGQSNDVEGRDDSDDTSGPRALTGSHVDSHRQAEAVKAVIGNLSPLLLMAPGLQERADVRRGSGRPSMKPRDSSSPDVPGADPMERLRQLYESQTESGGSEEAKQERPTSAKSRFAKAASSSPNEGGGFMGILKRKVLTPMKFKKLLGGVKEAAKLSDAEEGQSSGPATSDDEPGSPRMSDLLQRLNRVHPNDESASPKGRKSSPWKRIAAIAPPTVVVTESEESSRPKTPPSEVD